MRNYGQETIHNRWRRWKFYKGKRWTFRRLLTFNERLERNLRAIRDNRKYDCTLATDTTTISVKKKTIIYDDGFFAELMSFGEYVSSELTSMFLDRNKQGASCFRGCLGTAGRRTLIVRPGTRALSSPTGEHKLPIVENTTHCKGPLDTESTPLGESKNICFTFLTIKHETYNKLVEVKFYVSQVQRKVRHIIK